MSTLTPAPLPRAGEGSVNGSPRMPLLSPLLREGERAEMLQQFASDAALEGLNYLLRRERPARELLRPLAGRTARLQAGPLVLQFAVAADGSALASDADPHVTIDIGARALAAGLSDPAALLKDAQVWGDAEFAQVLSRVAERLRPDPEEDLSRLVGDFFFSSRRRHTRWNCDWSSDVCSSD